MFISIVETHKGTKRPKLPKHNNKLKGEKL